MSSKPERLEEIWGEDYEILCTVCIKKLKAILPALEVKAPLTIPEIYISSKS